MLPLKIRNIANTTTFTTSTQHYVEGSSQCSKVRKRNKSRPFWKGRSKTVKLFIYRQHDVYIEKPMKFTKTLLEMTSEFSEVSGYESIYKTQLYFYILAPNNRKLKLKIAVHINMKKHEIQISLTKDKQDLCIENFPA